MIKFAEIRAWSRYHTIKIENQAHKCHKTRKRMKQKIAILSITASCLLTGCCPKERTVEFPAVDAPNTTSAIIEKVELTDSVTNVHIRGYHRPKWWIRIVPETYLLADGKKYEVIGSEGIELGSKLHMPADGDSLFT